MTQSRFQSPLKDDRSICSASYKGVTEILHWGGCSVCGGDELDWIVDLSQNFEWYVVARQ